MIINYDGKYEGSGLMSEISWERLKPFLDLAFNKQTKEKLVGIEITERGIRAQFETKK